MSLESQVNDLQRKVSNMEALFSAQGQQGIAGAPGGSSGGVGGFGGGGGEGREGPAGPEGPEGPEGEPGIVGEVGPAGEWTPPAAGPAGKEGKAGPAGPEGKEGKEGPAGALTDRIVVFLKVIKGGYAGGLLEKPSLEVSGEATPHLAITKILVNGVEVAKYESGKLWGIATVLSQGRAEANPPFIAAWDSKNSALILYNPGEVSEGEEFEIALLVN